MYIYYTIYRSQDASIDALDNAIDRCKELVIVTDECSAERNWLVRHLVELRFRLNELQDVADDPQTDSTQAMVILGHHFVVGTAATTSMVRSRCDHCTGIIWSVVQASYVCSDCQYRVHHKCVHSIIRICAHVAASERDEPILEIAPEVGLSRQQYKCAECETPLNLSKWMWCCGVVFVVSAFVRGIFETMRDFNLLLECYYNCSLPQSFSISRLVIQRCRYLAISISHWVEPFFIYRL